jgi:alkylation response protein AidB-like acyl-CoA dehydrogenase
MGFMMEYPLHQFSRRAKVYEQSLGTAAQHRERFAELEARELAKRAAESGTSPHPPVPH